MTIQWFPGHMHSTRKALTERLKLGVDVVIELLDARLPGSSSNPLLAELTAGKPALKLLNKQDLADPARTELWLAHLNARPETRAIGLDASEAAPAARLIKACRELAPLRGGMALCSATGGALGTRSWAKRVADSSCSAGSSLTLIMASADVPTNCMFKLTSPSGS